MQIKELGNAAWARCLLSCVLLLGSVLSANASQFPFSGEATLDGQPFDGTAGFAFSLVDENGTALWMSGADANATIDVAVSQGRYLVLLGGQGMNPIEPGLLLDHSALLVRVRLDAKDGQGLRPLAPDRRLLSAPHALAAELADLADRAILADALADGSLTLDMLSPELRDKIERATNPDQLEEIFHTHFAERYRPQFDGEPSTDLAATIGQTVTLSPAVSGQGLSYQWKKNGQEIPGATASELNATAVAGDVYSVKATNLFGTDEKSFTLIDQSTIPVFSPSMIQRNRFSVYAHTMWIDENGSLWGVGDNGSGRIGDGTDKRRFSPVKVVDGGVASVSVSDHSFFIKEDGSLWAMGTNGYGHLGDGTTSARKSPIQIVDGGVIAVSLGGAHTLILKHDGSLWAMGLNKDGQLGDGTNTDRHLPVKVVDSGVTRISAGSWHSLFIKEDGSLWGMGGNGWGRLGDGTTIIRNVPVRVLDSNVTEISGGKEHSLFLKSDGSAWAMGRNGSGRLGDGSTTDRHNPVRVVDGNATAVYADNWNSYFLMADGSLWGCGVNSQGQLGIDPGISSSLASPTIVTEGVVKAAVGAETVLYLKNDGILYGHGKASLHQLADANESFSHLPHVLEDGNVTQVSTIKDHSLYLKADGSLWALGSDNSDKLGDGASRSNLSSPVRIVESNVTQLSAGWEHSLFVKADGSLWGMGNNGNGRLTSESKSTYSTPVRIAEANVTTCAAGNAHSLFIQTDGSLWAMGHNSFGQLGDGTNGNQRKFPVKIVDANVTAVEAGSPFSLFLKADGSVWSMGSNANGRLGYGGLGDRSSPVRIMDSGAIKIATGHTHAFILKANGSLWAFGNKGNGRLGELDKVDRWVPLKIVEEGVVAVAGGSHHSLFVKQDGSLWAMGHNGMGQLGLDPGTFSDRKYPVRVMDSGVAEVSAGNKHSMVLMKDGSVLTFGDDTYGQRGAGRMVWTYEPVQVTDGLGIP